MLNLTKMSGRWPLFVVLLMALSMVLVYQKSCSSNMEENARAVQMPSDLTDQEQQTIRIFEEAAPSVVFIKNASFQWDLFSFDIYEIPQGAGSGFVWDEQGHIITNFHVIYQADRIEVVMEDKKSYEAKVVGISPDHDLAVLKIDARGLDLKPIPLGISRDLKVGQHVLAIGNPFGLDHSLSSGIVSALGRSIQAVTGRKIFDMIQTDTVINPGNSGGPLLNSSGRLVGVATAIYSPSGAYAGVGFAIPVDTLARVVPQLIAYGKVKRIGMGVTLIPDPIRFNLGIEGAVVLDVIEEGPAHEAGLKPTEQNFFGEIVLGDVIVAVDGKEIKDNEDLANYFETKVPGEEVEVKIIRGESELTVQVPLKEL